MDNLTIFNENGQPTAEQLIGLYLQAYKEKSSAENTLATYKSALTQYERINGVGAELTFNEVMKMVNVLQAEGKQPQTINQYIGALGQVVEYFHDIGAIKTNFLDAKIFPRLPVIEKLHRNVTDTMDFREILEKAENARDKMMLILAGVAGLRVSEIIALNKEDFTITSMGYKILIKNPKNGKERYGIIAGEYIGIIKDYLSDKENGKALFCGNKGERLTRQGVDNIFKRYGDYSAHKYRHRCAETLYQAGKAVEDIAKHLGNTIAVCDKVYNGVSIDRQFDTVSDVNL